MVPRAARAQSLDGSSAAVERAYKIATELGFPFLKTGEEIQQRVKAGKLVKLTPSADITLHNVSFPFTAPQVVRFLRKLAKQYNRTCGEQLVVTSLVRPEDKQPRNASERSVHPTGMAADLRRSKSDACRSWLERTLLENETKGLIEATRERNPPHYHVVVFPRPQPYATKAGGGATKALPAAEKTLPAGEGAAPAGKVRSGAETKASAKTPRGTGGATKAGADSRGATKTAKVEAAAAQSKGGGAASRERTKTEPAEGRAAGSATKAPPALAKGGAKAGTKRTGRDTKAPTETYQVGPSDSLWLIARRFGTTVENIKLLNTLEGTRIRPGQTLIVPSKTAAAAERPEPSAAQQR